MTTAATATGNEGSKKGALKALLQKHNKSLAFIGALIVFTTFIVKEDLREYWKRTADTIETAQRAYSSQSDMQTLLSRLDELLREIFQTEYLVGRQGKLPSTDPESLGDSLVRSEVHLKQIREYVSSFEPLVALFPRNDPVRNQFAQLKASVADVGNLNSKSVALVVQLREAKKRNPKGISTERLQDAMFAAALSGAKVDLLWDSCFDVAPAVLKEAEQLRQRNATYSTWAGWASNGLYVLGWFLALIGRLYGVEGLGRPE